MGKAMSFRVKQNLIQSLLLPHKSFENMCKLLTLTEGVAYSLGFLLGLWSIYGFFSL